MSMHVLFLDPPTASSKLLQRKLRPKLLCNRRWFLHCWQCGDFGVQYASHEETNAAEQKQHVVNHPQKNEEKKHACK